MKTTETCSYCGDRLLLDSQTTLLLKNVVDEKEVELRMCIECFNTVIERTAPMFMGTSYDTVMGLKY